MAFLDPISDLFGVTGEDKGAQYQKQALNEFGAIEDPNLEDLQYRLQKMVYQGDITPEEAQVISQDPSRFNEITTNPAGRSAQLQALSQLQGIAGDGGMTAEDRTQLSSIQSQTDQAARGSREAILQNARERGVAGSGSELVAQLMGQQHAATAANQGGLDVAAQAQKRALEAILQSGQMGGQIQSQQFGEEAQKAGAQDAINRFNAQNRQDVVNQNVNTANQALYRNQDLKQDLSNKNTAIENEQAKVNAAARQQQFDNSMKKAGGMASGYEGLAEGKRQAEQGRQAFQGQLLGTAAQVGGGYLAGRNNPKKDPNALLSDETKKEGVTDIDMDSFLSSLDPKAFKYKDPNEEGASEGENVGVMAQDVEKSPVGKTMVKNTRDGKMLDMHKGFGVILAALAALNDKIESEKGEAA